jgi:PAS domain-containing protein
MTRPRSAFPPGARRPGFYAGSVLISLAVATLLITAFLPRLYNRPFSTVLLTLVLLALATAITLHIGFLILARREQRETADALSTTEHEFEAIFDSAIDALMILDERGICIEANPAIPPRWRFSVPGAMNSSGSPFGISSSHRSSCKP